MNDRINALLAETHNDLREQLSAAQRHFDRLEELLASRESPSRESKDLATLSRAVRRLRSSRNGEWVQIVNEAASCFASRAALFGIQSDSIQLEPARGRMPLETVPLRSAPAFLAAAESKDTVIAVRTQGELSAPIAAYFGESANGKCHLFPVTAGERVVALIYADGPEIDLQPDALELLATAAGAVLDGREATPVNGLVKITGALEMGESDVHLKAQRFASVLVAEMRLYQDEQVKNGRAAHDLYASLKPRIDEAREAYRSAFLANSEAVPDYLHRELVNTLANGDVAVLGQDYPGPLA